MTSQGWLALLKVTVSAMETVHTHSELDVVSNHQRERLLLCCAMR